jgi:hypothetical protein
MTKDKAIELGTHEAVKNKVKICIVNAPIENADDDSGPYGFTSVEGLVLLYKYGEIEAMISPNGTIAHLTVRSLVA